MEMRFHIPVSDSADQDPVELFHQEVMEKASVISVSGDAIATFKEIQCLTPRLVLEYKTLLFCILSILILIFTDSIFVIPQWSL